MEEIWKDIEGYEGYYQVSNLANVRSVDRQVEHSKSGSILIKGKILKKAMRNFGYQHVILSKNTKFKTMLIHRAVANAFLPNPNNYPCVLHLVESYPSIDIVNNLKWGSHKDNMEDMAYKGRSSKGIKSHFFGKKNGLSVLAKIVLDTESGIFYDCAKDAAYAKNIPYKQLSKKLSGTRKNNTSLIYV